MSLISISRRNCDIARSVRVHNKYTRASHLAADAEADPLVACWGRELEVDASFGRGGDGRGGGNADTVGRARGEGQKGRCLSYYHSNCQRLLLLSNSTKQ
jgi:hypothetical protein